MKRYGFLALGTLALLPSLAQAAQPLGAGAVDLYYIPSAGIEVTDPLGPDGDDDGDGFGVKGLFKVAESVALSGEYQSSTYDDSDADIDQLRLGVGFVGTGLSGIFAEYDKIDFDGEDIDGFSIRARLAGDLNPQFGLYGDIGYALLESDDEDIDGLEFTIGGVLRLNPQAGIFVDYRLSNLEGQDSGVEVELDDLRVGVRLEL
jgi:hypothetical protein